MPDDDSFLAPPPFKPAEALVQLRRSLRELRGLSERGAGFDWKGQAVVALEASDEAIAARLARRPARSPEWEPRILRSSADVRRFGDDVKRAVARWRDADE